MNTRNIAIAAISLLALGTTGCELYKKSDMRFSLWNWEQIDSGDCLAVGAYQMGVDLSAPPAQVKSSIKISPEFREDRDFFSSQLQLRYSFTRGITTTPLFNLNYDLKNGKGKASEITGPISLLAGDLVNVEACAFGDEGTFIPDDSTIAWRISWKYDRWDW